MSKRPLPAEFIDLAPFADEWALGCERDRHHNLLRHSIVEARSFYDAMMRRMDDIVPFLNRYRLDEMPEDVQNLMNLALAWAESAHPIDLNWRTTDIEDSFPVERMEYLGPSLR